MPALLQSVGSAPDCRFHRYSSCRHTARRQCGLCALRRLHQSSALNVQPGLSATRGRRSEPAREPCPVDPHSRLELSRHRRATHSERLVQHGRRSFSKRSLRTRTPVQALPLRLLEQRREHFQNRRHPAGSRRPDEQPEVCGRRLRRRTTGDRRPQHGRTGRAIVHAGADARPWRVRRKARLCSFKG
jgi:hypothetical protein